MTLFLAAPFILSSTVYSPIHVCRVSNSPICLPVVVPPAVEQPEQPHRGLCRMMGCPYCTNIRLQPTIVSIIIPDVSAEAIEFLFELNSANRIFSATIISETTFLYFSDGSRHSLRQVIDTNMVAFDDLVNNLVVMQAHLFLYTLREHSALQDLLPVLYTAAKFANESLIIMLTLSLDVMGSFIVA